ncbi:hypothetical protein E2704_12670 [Salmonella enterica]|uniref:Uncharacterized protein n=2 Tax=Salmonella enterica TaxID=28901 RepID=A0A3J4LF08_SALER|nr:hypothetical protein [Salmonella enterica]EAN8611908.1 hypothetical protein [Salmonella enterica subsp. arizonae serovar 48:z4,z24:-]EAO5937584.1 hypothetical protein [Salmonella enterica subsp. houtenae serovar 48:g,z51:-]EAO6000826.1 hypothetical protein [Salmonella enterica subsp. arizonae serovar 62:z36:-]EAT8890118.1 hypothetical protein [Salmonella enterica subsp. arizonae serovar 53:z4,z23,z32:-]EAW2115225.1 hypothetical protein [Salmonella enterica subsp. enterica]EBD1259752.1 hypo
MVLCLYLHCGDPVADSGRLRYRSFFLGAKSAGAAFFTQRFGIKKMLLVGLITAAIRYGFFVYGAQRRISLTPCRSTVFCCTA